MVDSTHSRLSSTKGKKDIQKSKSIFLLVSLPSTVFEDELSPVIQDSTEEVNPWVIHWLLVADSTRGWPEYISWIEGQLQERVYSCLIIENIANETVSTDLRGHCWR